ncbi:MAG TPA: AMP-binding protein [Rectinemataceae bacterium]|nr:AMP-binding protein [Rectinemataceae bacterium]
MADTIPQLFLERVTRYPELPAQLSKNGSGAFTPVSYAELLEQVKAFAAGLTELGMVRGDHVGIISDNRREWLVADLAILGMGAADVPRGCDATEQEIRYILDFSGCKLAILENDKQLRKVLAHRNAIAGLRTVIMLEAPESGTVEAAARAGLEIRSYEAVFSLGKTRAAAAPRDYETAVAAGKREDLATIIYTSGTTGEPKGVMLSHGNFLHQTDYLPSIILIKPGHIFLSVLPIWHSFERIAQYMIIAAAACVAYSKPVGSVMLADLQEVRPQWMASVPRIWESVRDGIYRNLKSQGGAKQLIFTLFVGVGTSYAYFRNHLRGWIPEFVPRSRFLEMLSSILPVLLLAPFRALGDLLVFSKVKEKLGGRFIAGISGGGALPPAVDRFFGALGVLILEGYGLTETAPDICVREQLHPVVGTVGKPIKGTELLIVDEQGHPLPPGHKGLILCRGPSVMQGYYRRPELTAKVMRPEGWLDTGDLGMLTFKGELRITGRAKDTIVLRGGENIEPVPIEQRIVESEFIQQAVVLGQDQKYLAALIVPAREALVAWAEENNIPIVDYETLLQQPEVSELIDAEINLRVNTANGFKSFERIFRFALLPNAFEQGKELSAKQEVKRFAVNELYQREIHRLFEA